MDEMKKLTIMVSEEVYTGRHTEIVQGPLESLARPHVVDAELDAAYRTMALDDLQEAEAAEWADNLIGDVAEEAR